MEWRVTEAIKRLHEKDPDLALILEELLSRMETGHLPRRPNLDWARLLTPQILLFAGGGTALLLQYPLATIIELIKAVGPLLSP